MRKLSLLLLAGLGAARYAPAQRLQNMDIYYLGAPAHAGSHRISGSDVTLDGATGVYLAIGYGYQLVRFSAASVWLDISTAFASSGSAVASSGGSALTSFNVFAPGVRLMLPVQSRVSLYGVAGYGFGRFYEPVLNGTQVTSNSTTHGVFGFGGGGDIRLSRFFSIRVELRDFVTGRGLSGASGRHHPVPAAGIALHH